MHRYKTDKARTYDEEDARSDCAVEICLSLYTRYSNILTPFEL